MTETTDAPGFAAWDPFTDPTDAKEGRTTHYELPSSDAKANEEPAEWDPFEDLELLELAGDLALESEDADALEVWIRQAKAAGFTPDKLRPKEDRLAALRAAEQRAKLQEAAAEKFEEALQGEDSKELELAVEAAAEASALPPQAAARAADRLAELREREVKLAQEQAEAEAQRRAEEREELKASAQDKLARKRLVPSVDVELSEQELATLESERIKENIAPKQSVCIKSKVQLTEFPIRVVFQDGLTEEIQVDPCSNASSLLLQLWPLRRSHTFPRNFVLLLPSGQHLDFDRPLQVQGICSGIELRLTEASTMPPQASGQPKTADCDDEADTFDEEEFAQEVEMGWNLIYWPLCVAQTAFAEVLAALRRHKEVVVLAWGACHDQQVMQLSREISHNVSSDYFIAAGSEDPPEDWWPTSEEEAILAAAAATKQFSLRGSGAPGTLPKTSVLKLPWLAPPDQLGPALLKGLRAAGCGESLALLVVSRAFQSRRPVSVLNWSLRQEEFAHLRVSVLPYSWDPRFVYKEDCRQRPDDVLQEAQLLTEMNPSVWLEEEGQEAEIALSRLLSAHPQPERPHWHKGFYSKPFKDHVRRAREGHPAAGHCEWHRWQRSTPLSAASRQAAAKAAAPPRPTAKQEKEEEEEDEEPPPLVSHE